MKHGTASFLHLIRKQGQKRVPSIVKSGFCSWGEAIAGITDYTENRPPDHKKSRAAVDSILKDAFELVQSGDLETSDRISATKLVISTIQARLALVIYSGILDKAAKYSEGLKKKPHPTANLARL